jgi:Protein of unknown function (DUF992)
MSRAFCALATVTALAIAASPATAQPTYARSGLLTCNLSASVGLVLGGRQGMSCRFQPDHGGWPQHYIGYTTTLGVDLGVTGGGVMVWAVLLSSLDPYPGALAGSYVGASGSASFGVGAGANVLVGASNQTVALQPLSLEGSIGINVAGGVTGVELRYVPDIVPHGRHRHHR